MAQDKKKALDEKTRKLSEGKIEQGKEHAAYQEAQQQLLAIQAEQQQNLAVARAESKASFDNHQTLAQAAELGAISAAEAEQAAAAGAQAGAQLNPATQQILSKYGAGQPKFQRSQSHSQQVTKQNITINNNITSNTTNDVKVPANIGGPLQGRPLQFKTPQASGEGSVGKFKNWISAAFARQNEEGARLDREYRHRESSLTTSAAKMMKKLEEIGKTIGSRLDPRKIGSTWQSQLKTLLFLFGFGYLTSNWTKILAKVADIENWVKGTWNYFTGSVKEGKRTFISDIKSFLGAKEGESVFDALKELFIGKDGFLGLLKEYFNGLIEDRSKAIKMVKFPDIDLGDLMGTIKNIGLYLGDLLSAMVSGASGVKSSIERNIKDISTKGGLEQAQKDSATMSTGSFKTTSGKEIDADVGIGAILNNKYTGLTRHSLDSEGNLTNKYGAESTVAQASDISRLFIQANSGGKIDSTQLSAGLSRLMKASQDSVSAGNSGIPVQASFLRHWFTNKELGEMLKKGELKNQWYYMVLRKKTDEDNILENTHLTNTFSKEYAEKKIGNLARKATGNEDSFLGNIYGGYQYAKGAAHLGETLYNKITDNDYRVEYVKQPRDGDEIVDDGKGNARKVVFVEITPSVVQKIADRITGKENTNIDLKDRNFVTDVQQGLVSSARVALGEEIKRREEYRKTHLTDFDNNRKLTSLRNRRTELSTTDAAKIDYNLDEAYRQYDDLVKTEEEIKNRLDEKYETSRVAAAGRNINNAVGGALETINDAIYNTTNGTIGKLPKSKSGYVSKMRPLFTKILESKSFIPKDKIPEYANILTAQSALESDWGGSKLSTQYNNLSGMTKGTAKFHSTKSVTLNNKQGKDKNTYAVFDSIEDWADDYVEYLNRKWKAFDGNSSQFFNRLQKNKSGQSYATDPDYIRKASGVLDTVKTVQPVQAGNIAAKAVEASKSGKFYSNTYKREIYLDESKKGLDKGGVRTGQENQYKGLCTSGPGTWYEQATGIKIGNWWNTGNPETATDTTITKKGFTEVWAGSAEDAKANKMNDVLQPGDVMVSYGRKANGESSSHAQMWNGEKWLSDTIQNSTFVYKSGRMGNRSAVLYRYGGGEQGNYTPSTGTGTNQNPSNLQTQSGESGSKQPRTFLEILKEKISDFIMGVGGMFSSKKSDKKQNPTEKIPESELPEVVITGKKKDKSSLPEMNDYETYLKNQDNLPEGIPKGLNPEEWSALTSKATDAVEPETELREDSKNILGKYTKSEEPEFLDQKVKNIEDQEYEKDIHLLEGPVFRNTHSEDYIANVQRVKDEKEKETVAERKTNPEVEVKPLDIETPKTAVSGILTALAGEYEKKKDIVDIVETGFSNTNTTLRMIGRINSTNGMIAAKNVDATRITAQVINNSAARTAQSERMKDRNQVREGRSLVDPENQTIKQISETT